MSNTAIKPHLPKHGQLILEDLDELVLCKPRLIPLKSLTLEKLERMQEEAQKTIDNLKNKDNEDTN